jgi:hypothetical protein
VIGFTFVIVGIFNLLSMIKNPHMPVSKAYNSAFQQVKADCEKEQRHTSGLDCSRIILEGIAYKPDYWADNRVWFADFRSESLPYLWQEGIIMDEEGNIVNTSPYIQKCKEIRKFKDNAICVPAE